MKRSPLKRRTPLRSRKVLKPAKGRAPKKQSAYAKRQRAGVEWWAFLHSSPCVVAALVALRSLAIVPDVLKRAPNPQHDEWSDVIAQLRATACSGPPEADHSSQGRGLGRKSKDRTCIPLCKGHHEDRTNGVGLRGAFATFTRLTMRDWDSLAIAYTHSNAKARGIAIPEC